MHGAGIVHRVDASAQLIEHAERFVERDAPLDRYAARAEQLANRDHHLIAAMPDRSFGPGGIQVVNMRAW